MLFIIPEVLHGKRCKEQNKQSQEIRFKRSRFSFAQKESNWSASKKCRWKQERQSKWRLRERIEWEVSTTRASRKTILGKSIWEWVRLTLTPSMQPAMSWEESSWQCIRVLDEGREINSSARLKHSLQTQNNMSKHADKPPECMCGADMRSLRRRLHFRSVRHARDAWQEKPSAEQQN